MNHRLNKVLLGCASALALLLASKFILAPVFQYMNGGAETSTLEFTKQLDAFNGFIWIRAVVFFGSVIVSILLADIYVFVTEG